MWKGMCFWSPIFLLAWIWIFLFGWWWLCLSSFYCDRLFLWGEILEDEREDTKVKNKFKKGFGKEKKQKLKEKLKLMSFYLPQASESQEQRKIQKIKPPIWLTTSPPIFSANKSSKTQPKNQLQLVVSPHIPFLFIQQP